MTCVSTLASSVIVRKDALGGLRVWSYEVRGNQYRTISGTKFGMRTPSSWTICAGKQGRSDADAPNRRVDCQVQVFDLLADHVHGQAVHFDLVHAILCGMSLRAFFAKQSGIKRRLLQAGEHRLRNDMIINILFGF